MSPSPESPPASNPLRVGFLLSGSGRTLENLNEYLERHRELASIVAVVSSRPGVKGLERAERFGIPATVIPCRQPADSRAIFEHLETAAVDLVLLGGWLRLLHVPTQWEGRILNIHPSLLPKYGGQGFYGDRVHSAVLESGEPFSGCSVHFVDNVYDHGEVLLQESVPVEANDTVDTLAARVFEAECRAYPRALQQLKAQWNSQVWNSQVRNTHGRQSQARQSSERQPRGGSSAENQQND